MGKCCQSRRCTCTIVAGPGTSVDGAGTPADPTVVTARPSTDAGNALTFGTDGGLLIPAASVAEPLETGCGLQGDGTTAAPLTAQTAADQRPWTDDWDCEASEHSTLRCDPDTGALWAPPEHTSAALTLQQLHPLGTPTLGPTSGFVLVDESAWAEGSYLAESLTTCRGISFSARFTGHAEAEWEAGSTFSLGYAIQIDGGPLAVRVLHSRLQAGGIAGHERWSFGVSQAAVLASHTGYVVRVYPAIQVLTGSVTLHEWITDTDMTAMTR